MAIEIDGTQKKLGLALPSGGGVSPWNVNGPAGAELAEESRPA